MEQGSTQLQRADFLLPIGENHCVKSVYIEMCSPKRRWHPSLLPESVNVNLLGKMVFGKDLFSQGEVTSMSSNPTYLCPYMTREFFPGQTSLHGENDM